MRDLSRLTGTAVYQGRTAAFRVLWALWHARGATLDALAQATTPDEEAFRGQAHASAFWRESLAHRVFSRWTDEAFPDRLAMWRALKDTGVVRVDDTTADGDTLLHTLLRSSSFQSFHAAPSAALRRDACTVAQDMVEMGLGWRTPDHKGVCAYRLALKGIPELAVAWEAQEEAGRLGRSLPDAGGHRDGRKRL